MRLVPSNQRLRWHVETDQRCFGARARWWELPITIIFLRSRACILHSPENMDPNIEGVKDCTRDRVMAAELRVVSQGHLYIPINQLRTKECKGR
jgi:hypothetical protein